METLGEVGIWSLELRQLDARSLMHRAQALEQDGWRAVWIAGANGPGIWQHTRTILGATSRLHVAHGVVSIWGEDGARAPEQFVRATAGFGPRVLAGFGVSNPRAAAAAGRAFGTAWRAMSEYLDGLDARLPDSIAPEQRILGALGPRMIRLARDRAAGVHPFLITPEASARFRGLLGPDARLLPQQAVVLSREPQEARAIARRGIGMYLRFPTYQNSLREQGFDEADLAGNGSDRLIDALVVWGDAAAVGARVNEHLAAGADHVALQVLTGHGGVPSREWRELTELLSR